MGRVQLCQLGRGSTEGRSADCGACNGDRWETVRNQRHTKPTPIGSHVQAPSHQSAIEIHGPTSTFGSASMVGSEVILTMERSSSVGEKVCPDLRFSLQLTFRKEDPVVCLGLDIR